MGKDAALCFGADANLHIAEEQAVTKKGTEPTREVGYGHFIFDASSPNKLNRLAVSSSLFQTVLPVQ